jgi:hypothetical protein
LDFLRLRIDAYVWIPVLAIIMAVVKPIPDELPVTNATLFLIVIFIFSIASSMCMHSRELSVC